MNFSKYSLLLLMLLVFTSQAALAFWGTDKSLDAAVQQLVQDLVKSGNLKGGYVLINPEDIYDGETRLSLPLAGILRNRLVTGMQKVGVRVLLPGADEDASMVLQGTWGRQGDELAIDVKVMRLAAHGPEVVAAASAKVSLDRIDRHWLIPDKKAWARYFVRQLKGNMGLHSGMAVYVAPFHVRGQPCSGQLGLYLSDWLRPAMAESGVFRPLDQRRELKNVAVETLRRRGTRDPHAKAAKADEQSLTAKVLNADAELKGDVYVLGDTVEILAKLIDRKGEQISAGSVEVEKTVFPPDLFAPSFSPDSPVTVSRLVSVCLAKDGLELDLTSTRGQDRPYYRNGEVIRFVMGLNKPAWVYVFDFNPAGEVTLLYPVDDCGRLAKNAGFVRHVDEPLILPEDGYSYELIADAPFGSDTVWAVASEMPLEFPADMNGDWGRAENLVTRLRKQGSVLQKGYAEARLELVTGE